MSVTIAGADDLAREGGGPRRIEQPTILVPIGCAAEARGALLVARELAHHSGVTVHAIHMADRVHEPRELMALLAVSPEELHGVVLDGVANPPATSVGSAIVRIAQEQHSRLIVMCTHAAVPNRAPALGPVVVEVLEAATCPVLLVPADRDFRTWKFRRVLFPFDGTPTMTSAMTRTAELTSRAGASLLVLHVNVTPCRASNAEAERAEPGTLAPPRYCDQPQHEWPEWRSEFLERIASLCKMPPGVELRLFLAAGDPGVEIARFASERQVDLIAVACHGRFADLRAETLKALLRNTLCPIAIQRV